MLIFSYPAIFQPTESIYNSFKHSQSLVNSKLGPRGPKIGPKPTQNGQNHYISIIKRARMLIFLLSRYFPTH